MSVERWTRICFIAIHFQSSDAHTIGRTSLGSDAANEVVDKYPDRALIFHPKVVSLWADGVENEPSADGLGHELFGRWCRVV